MRFLFYSHDGLGLGHTRRHLAIANALVTRSHEASLLIATGADDVHRLGLPACVEVLKLPSLRKIDNETYGSRRLRVPSEDIRRLRAALLLVAVETYRPDVLLVDKHPLGAAGELTDALKAARRMGTRTVLGLRDILDAPEVVRAEWAPYRLQEKIAQHFDRVLVYGQQAVFDPVKEYALPSEVAARTRFCGYVANTEQPVPGSDRVWDGLDLGDRSRPVVLATAGGGEDGFELLSQFITAARDATWRGVAVTGPQMPDDKFDTLAELGRAHCVAVHLFVPHLQRLLRRVDALVCMGGYNTLAEAAAAAVPTVCVPRVQPRQEQLIRARAFEHLGLLRVLTPEALTPARLGSEIEATLGTDRRALATRVFEHLAFDGAANTAGQLLELAAAPRAAVAEAIH